MGRRRTFHVRELDDARHEVYAKRGNREVDMLGEYGVRLVYVTKREAATVAYALGRRKGERDEETNRDNFRKFTYGRRVRAGNKTRRD